MSQTITIDPVTRLEGHGKITIQLNGQGEVEDAHFHVTQVRGFERFSEGQPVLRDAQPDGARLRHLPGEPLDRLGESLRGHHVCADSLHGRTTAPHAEPCADGAVACIELLSISHRPTCCWAWKRIRRYATFSAWLRQNLSWAGRASVCAALGSTLSSCLEQTHPHRMGCTRWRDRSAECRRSAMRCWATLPEAYAQHQARQWTGTRRLRTASGPRSRSSPTFHRSLWG